MRNRGFLICSIAVIFSIGMLYAQNTNENWMDEPYTKWDQKQVAELYNKSAWAQTKSFRGQPANISRTGAARLGEHGTETNMGAGGNSNGNFGTGAASYCSGKLDLLSGGSHTEPRSKPGLLNRRTRFAVDRVCRWGTGFTT